MAIQVFGSKKSFDTKKAERWFTERRIQFQKIDLNEKPMSAGEFDSVVTMIARVVGSRSTAIESLIDTKNKCYAEIAYIDDADKADKLFENQQLFVLPIVRNTSVGSATVGYQPDVWKTWQ